MIIEYLRSAHDHRGATIWLTGLPAAGKTTIAEASAERLRAEGRRVVVLDGDDMRRRVSPELGFGKEDRDTNVRRIGFMARLLAENGVLCLVAVIAPYASSRAAVRTEHEHHGATYLEVHVAAPVELCAARDPKGLYARQAAGALTGLTGVDDPYEAPVKPDLRIDTEHEPVWESAARVCSLITES